jgi:hypothetical protein
MQDPRAAAFYTPQATVSTFASLRKCPNFEGFRHAGCVKAAPQARLGSQLLKAVGRPFRFVWDRIRGFGVAGKPGRQIRVLVEVDF